MTEEKGARCPKCGVGFRASTQYCGYCGTRLTSNATMSEKLVDAMIEDPLLGEFHCSPWKHQLTKEIANTAIDRKKLGIRDLEFCPDCGEKL